MSNEKNTEKIQLIEGWSFNRTNYIIFFIGVFFIIFGYIIMANGTVNSFQSLTLARRGASIDSYGLTVGVFF